ncbi:protein translocase subunit SecD [Neogemmobacter tilapiae]|uniref:Protein translocase subunit SecD n=1 Tax=Neogemmobacter tilapiae TaxID=875041 RepID=A0A918THW6_9RHOB|nr:protein translocase subunit SecD [Gemmobacter tilapiae]GHC46666.1 protein translocase subunit SecD [Gemmobacter tilapiae]
MQQMALWKRLLIWATIALGVVYAAPNAFYARVEGHNDAAKLFAEGAGLTAEQQAAYDAWPEFLPSTLMNLGLDLRGGAHLLAEVQVKDVYKTRMDGLWPGVRDALRDIRDQVGNVRREPSAPDELRIAISNPEGMQAAITAVAGLAQPISSLTGMGEKDITVSQDKGQILVRLSEAEQAATDSRTVQQSLEIVRRRIDEAGTREPSIQRQGTDRILIQVPGIGSAAELKEFIGKTAKLGFYPVVRITQNENDTPGPRNFLAPSLDEKGLFYVLEETPVVTGEELTNAAPSFDDNGTPSVNFQFNVTGARAFGEYTANNVGKPFAIVLDNEVISAPTINQAIPGGSGRITGNFTIEESTNLAVLLRAGALPAELTYLEERTVGPELGQDSIDAGMRAAVIGMIAVVAYMVASYGFFGAMASMALAINIVLMIALLNLIGATLTLPGIAGIVLTMGMAVDANVLIYERIREELRQGVNPARAIELGFEKALSAITDSNVTAILTAIIMYWIGSGPVRGFAVTLGLGIITSMFTAVYVTRLIIQTWMAWRRPKTIVV